MRSYFIQLLAPDLKEGKGINGADNDIIPASYSKSEKLCSYDELCLRSNEGSLLQDKARPTVLKLFLNIKYLTVPNPDQH